MKNQFFTYNFPSMKDRDMVVESLPMLLCIMYEESNNPY